VRTVASFREPFKAHLAKGRLEAEGIQALVLDENLARINWGFSQAIGGVKIQVSEEHLDQAREILGADYTHELSAFEEAQLEATPDDVCPECGSDLISPRRYSLWSLIPSLVFLLPIFFRRKKRMCNECGATFR
jgi:hypothetical protein